MCSRSTRHHLLRHIRHYMIREGHKAATLLQRQRLARSFTARPSAGHFRDILPPSTTSPSPAASHADRPNCPQKTGEHYGFPGRLSRPASPSCSPAPAAERCGPGSSLVPRADPGFNRHQAALPTHRFAGLPLTPHLNARRRYHCTSGFEQYPRPNVMRRKQAAALAGAESTATPVPEGRPRRFAGAPAIYSG